MCFCVNNQFRIIVEGSATGSDNLEEVFQTNLRRIGQVVAVLDTWEEPVYLQRVWTIYEQYVACSLQVPVTFVMPEDAAASGRYRWKNNLSKAPVWSLKLPWCRSKVTCSRSLLQNSLPYFRVRKFEACEASLSKQFLVTPIQHTFFYTLVQYAHPLCRGSASNTDFCW